MEVFLVLLVTALLQHTQGCGVSTHLDIANRARAFFDYSTSDVDYRQLLDRHTDAFQGSTSFPDIFYNSLCLGGDLGSISEDTHWTPFVNASVNYIRDNYPKPWDESTEKLVVFLFGIMSHQISDVLWHSLDIDRAFLETMGYVNFHGSFSDAHNVGDFGGDVMNRYDLDLSFIKKLFHWFIPTQDLANIYQLYYGDTRVTEDMIITCSNWMYFARLGEQLGVIEALFPSNSEASPFLADRLQDFFFGGMDDMSLWVADRWRITADLLEHGTQTCDLPHNPLFITCEDYLMHQETTAKKLLQQKTESLGLRNSHLLDLTRHYNFDTNVLSNGIDITRKNGGVTFEMGISFEQRLNQALEAYKELADYKKDKAEKKRMQPSISKDATYTTAHDYSRLGEVVLLADVNQDGTKDLVVGAPGYSVQNGYQNGRVYVIFGSSGGFENGTALIEDSADMILEAPDANGRFGTSAVTVDINQDSYQDLVVSAPNVGALDLEYKGKVYIYLGEAGGISSEPDITISCTETYCNYGWELQSGDLDVDGYPDLLVGSPFAQAGGEQRGFVNVFYAQPSFEEQPNRTEENADWRFEGEQDFEWFGWSISVGRGHAVFCAPNHRICAEENCNFNEDDTQAVGKAEVYSLPLTGQPSNVLTGETEFMQLGYDSTFLSESVDNEYLVLSALSAGGSSASDQPGAVLAYLLDESNATVMELEGDREYSRFGTSINSVEMNADGTQMFVVGSPRWRDNDNVHIGGAGPGRAFVFGKSESEDIELMFTLESEDFKSQFGFSTAASVFSGKTVVTSGAPFSNKGAILGGSVEIFSFALSE